MDLSRFLRDKVFLHSLGVAILQNPPKWPPQNYFFEAKFND